MGLNSSWGSSFSYQSATITRRTCLQAIREGALQLSEAQVQGLNLACTYKRLKKVCTPDICAITQLEGAYEMIFMVEGCA